MHEESSVKPMYKNPRPYQYRLKVCKKCRKRYSLSYFDKHKCKGEEGVKKK
ncbi:hypothetical protein GCM10008933_12140 [Paenibacillus motobuensis]|uniref:Uncharacterized protein n=1 Tax=Paenibacillus motobuensis TaxID=295324 RepID=A0ABN0Y442_9BACL